ncbi:ATP-binding protein [Alteromonas confluentis]|uniref:histidine kinase n=1 Tax=Alteromonas confluentis TaxID=1656094 RepID=A0A1E7ZA30_9ALTE|nr:ATP-binding protein [Alteromonas confluentis]OFC70388.1 hybrid sensor histidine kinase/response regulator [Alteromonas confluentis]
MQPTPKITTGRRIYNKLVANEMMEDFALRFTAIRARKWSYSRIANTALGIVSFMVLEAIGGAITLNYGFTNAAWAILALVFVIFISGTPISYYAAKYGVDIDLLSRGAGFGYIGSTIASLIYASFTFIFFALEAAIMSMALELLFGLPLYLGYALSALVVMPLVTHGITYISRFQVWTQPVWIVLQLIPLLYVFNHPDSSLREWVNFTGDAEVSPGTFNIFMFGAASAVLLSLVAQIGEQVDVLRFLPPKPKNEGAHKWWFALIMAGPGWIIFGAGKLFLGSFLAYLALKQGVTRDLASDPAHMYQVAFGYIFNNTTASVVIATAFVIISQLKINVANAYAGSLAWSNFFSRITHNHPGRVVWMIFNILIALLLMELGIYQTIKEMLQIYSVLVLSWLSSVAADLLINKPLGFSPPIVEFKRSKLYDINPVGTFSMFFASLVGFGAHFGLLGEYGVAMGSFIAFFLPFITVPLIGYMTRGKYYLVPNQTHAHLEGDQQACCICEHTFDREDMSFCPAYQQPICSLCCSLDVRCNDQCRPGATLSAQALAYFRNRFSTKTIEVLTSPIALSLTLTMVLSLISAAILSLIYFQIPPESLELREIQRDSLYKVFFFLLIIIGVVSWLFTLAKISNNSALRELRSQTMALATEVAAHEKTATAYQIAKEEAESANKAKSRYLAGLSHELRTPLNVLLGYSQLLFKDDQLPTRIQGPLNTMRRNCEHLGDLIEGVLEVSKIEAGRLSVHKEDIQLHSFLEQMVNMFEQQASSKGLEFNCSFTKNLPAMVSGDKQRLRQILINLISNAIKFTSQGSVNFTVTYRNEVAHFTVEDTGTGIAKKDLETIFHPFERVAGTETTVAGTGLGLTISRALAELMGGEISVTSEPEKGSKFRLSLMLPRLSSENREVILDEKKIYGYEGERKTIITIDDEVGQRDLLADILTPLGFNVIKAESAKHGIVSVMQGEADLLLLDLKMPEISGWEVARMIRQAQNKIPIIIISANVRELDADDNAQQFHSDYLTKPFLIPDLLDKVGHWLGIQWVYEQKPELPQETETPESTLPPAGKNQYVSLRSMAEIGYLSGFNSKLDAISETHTIPAKEAKALRQLASKIQFKKVVEILDGLIAASE